jgi:hypothetical protein
MSIERITPETLATKGPGAPTRYLPEYCELIKVIGAEGDSVVAMAVACGVHRDTIYEWAKVHPQFSDALEMAVQLSQLWWENLARGQANGDNRGNSSTLALMMKNRFHRDYKEKHELGIIGGDGPPLEVDQKWVIEVVDCGVKS